MRQVSKSLEMAGPHIAKWAPCKRYLPGKANLSRGSAAESASLH